MNNKDTSSLAEINKKIIAEGEQLPLVQLKDGAYVQTGTVATMLHNIKLYNAGERGAVEQELITSIPTLIKVGLFELFNPEEWIASCNPGRKFVGLKAKELLENH